MMNCLNCQKEVPQQEGRRAKLYCSDKCKSSYHRKGKSDVITLSRCEYEKMIAYCPSDDELLKRSIYNFSQGIGKGFGIKYVDPLTTEQDEAVYNAAHKDSKVYSTVIKQPDRLEGESLIDYKIRMAEDLTKLL